MKMRIVSKFVAAGLIMLAVGETCSYAAPGIVGVNYGPYHKPGQDARRPDDPPISDTQFREDLSKIVQKFGYIRTYGTEKRVQGLVPFIAQNFPDLNVYLGITNLPSGVRRLKNKSPRPSNWRISIPISSSMSSSVTNAWTRTLRKGRSQLTS
jgi:hypothetical protein